MRFVGEHREPAGDRTGLAGLCSGVLAAAALSLTSCQTFEERCEGWHSSEFFAEATIREIEGCLRRGRGVNDRGTGETTPIHAAVNGGSLGGLAVLIKAGGNPNVRDAFDMTPLVYLLHPGTPRVPNLDVAPMVRGLLAFGADPNISNWRGMAPLHHAARINSAESLGMLLDAGADPNAISPEGNALHLLMRNRHPDKDAAVHLLRAGTNPNAPRGEVGERPLHLIAHQVDPTIVNLLIAAGAHVNVADRFGLTPLHAAAVDATGGVLQTLLDAGANPQARDDRGRTPLHYAVVADQPKDVIQLLLSAGSDPNSADRGGNTALHLAAYWTTHLEVVDELRFAGARCDVRNALEQTPAEMARTGISTHLDRVAAVCAANAVER